MRAPVRVLICITVLCLAHPVSAQEKDFRIQVSVEEVRLDAVVLDKRGNQITNLTAKDFRIFQNGKSCGTTLFRRALQLLEAFPHKVKLGPVDQK